MEQSMEGHEMGEMIEAKRRIAFGFGSGGVSVESRVKSAEISGQEVEDLITDVLANPDEYICDVKMPAALSCGDERFSGETGEGYKVFGGLAFFKNVDRLTNNLTSAYDNFNDRLDFVGKRLISVGLLPGGHTDDHSHGPDCGCGAMDKKPQSHAALEVFQSEISAKSAEIMAHYDLEFDEDAAQKIFESNRAILAEAMPDGATQMDALRNLIEKTRQGRVEALHGNHNGVAIALVNRPGQTLDREKINRVTNGRLQIFGTDVPAILIGARELSLPESDEKMFIQGAVMWTLAVGAVITDGSLDILFIDGE